MSLQLNEEQILEALGKLSPQARTKALRKLIRDLDQLDRIVDRNQERLIALCKARGIDFKSLTDQEREELVDRILHED